MSRRETWLSAGAIFVLALAVRAVAAAAVTFPVPEDTAYYDSVARNLLEGRGLISDALWSYQTQPLVVPRAAFEVWLPLPSLLAAIPLAAVGVGNWFRAAQVMSVLASSCVAVLAWRLGADLAAEMQLPVGRARTMGLVHCAVAGRVPADDPNRSPRGRQGPRCHRKRGLNRRAGRRRFRSNR
jgi:hypothetical protein